MAIEHTLESPLALAVRAATSQSAFARAIGRSQAFVHGLLRDGKPLPGEYVFLVEREFGISRHDLRPDLYPDERTPAAAHLDHAAATRGATGTMEPAR